MAPDSVTACRATAAGSSDAALVVGERFHLDAVDWYRRAVAPPAGLTTVSRGYREPVCFDTEVNVAHGRARGG